MKRRDLLQKLLDAGAYICVPDPSSSWCDVEIDTKDEARRWLDDPDEFVSKYHKVDKRTYIEYLAVGGLVCCDATTSKGKPCRIVVEQPKSVEEYAQAKRDRHRCNLHGGRNKRADERKQRRLAW